PVTARPHADFFEPPDFLAVPDFLVLPAFLLPDFLVSPAFLLPDFLAPPDFLLLDFLLPDFLVPPDFSPSSPAPVSPPRRLRTLRSRASMRLMTLPPSSESSPELCFPKVASVSTVSPSSSFASSSRRSSAWYSSVNCSGWKSSLNCSTSAADISISFAETFDLEGPKSTSLRSVGQRRVCRA